MYEDMIDHLSGNWHCKKCNSLTRHSLVEYVLIDENINIIEVIDSWYQCQTCDKTTSALVSDEDYPF